MNFTKLFHVVTVLLVVLALGSSNEAISKESVGQDKTRASWLTGTRAGHSFFEKGDYKNAEAEYKKALDFATSVGQNSAERSASLNNLGDTYRAEGKYDLALPMYKESLSIAEKIMSPTDDNIATIINNTAVASLNLKQYSEAEMLFKKSLVILGVKDINNLSGIPETYKVAATIGNLAEVYRAQNKIDLTIPLYSKSLDIAKKLYHSDNHNLAIAYNNLATGYLGQGKFDMAEPLLIESLAITERVLGKDNPRLWNALNNLAYVYIEQKNFEKAKGYLQRAYTMTKNAWGEDNPDVKFIANHLKLVTDMTSLLSKGLIKVQPEEMRGFISSIVTDKHVDFISLASRNSLSKARLSDNSTVPPESSEEKKGELLSAIDRRKVIEHGVSDIMLELCGQKWETDFALFMKGERGLKRTDKQMAYIGVLHGFSMGYFEGYFKEHGGCTPSMKALLQIK